MSNSFAKPAFFLKLVSWASYLASGWVTWTNGEYTLIAYRDIAQLPDPLPLMAAVVYSIIQSAFFAYLFAPEIWQEVVRDFQAEANQGMGGFQGGARWTAAVALSLKLIVMVGTVAASIWADWQSTIQYLDLQLQTFEDMYTGAIALMLVLGGEVLMIFGYQMWRLARLHGIKQAQEAYNLNPTWYHAEAAAKAATEAAKKQAQAMGQQWGQPRS